MDGKDETATGSFPYSFGIASLRSKSISRRIIWILILIIAISLFCLHCYTLMRRYFLYEVITHWESTDKRSPKFPTVILCDAAPFSFYRSEEGIFKTATDNESISNVMLFRVQSFWRTALKITPSHGSKYDRSLNPITRLSLQPYSFNYNFTHQIQDALVECYYNKVPCGIQNFTRMWLPYYNHCYSFKPDNNIMIRRGSTSGLSLILYTNDRRGLLTDRERLTWFRGFYLILVEDGYMPLLDNVIEIPTGYSTSVTFKQTHFTRSPDSAASCVDEQNKVAFSFHDESGLYQTPVQFHDNEYVCRIKYLQSQYLSKCGCFDDLNLIPVKNISSARSFACHHIPDQHLLINKGYEGNITHTIIRIGVASRAFAKVDPIFSKMKAQHECMENIVIEKAGSNCRKPCRNIDYPTQTRSFQWPSRMDYSTSIMSSLKRSLKESTDRGLFSTMSLLVDANNTKSKWNRSLSKIRSSFLNLDIYATSLDVFTNEESLAYPFGNLLSDFGGTLGLWIGCSIISVIELGWIISLAIAQYSAKQKLLLNSEIDDDKMERENKY